MIDLTAIDKTWTLFLDRDGVINEESTTKHEYILKWEEFRFMQGAKEAIKIFTEKFGLIVIATNQRCVGLGLITEDGLQLILNNMAAEIADIGGKINGFYYAPDEDREAINRKPQIGMALQAKADFPQIDFAKSIMVGNRVSDMGFGKNAGMKTVFVATTDPEVASPHPLIDLRFDDLISFAKAL